MPATKASARSTSKQRCTSPRSSCERRRNCGTGAAWRRSCRGTRRGWRRRPRRRRSLRSSPRAGLPRSTGCGGRKRPRIERVAQRIARRCPAVAASCRQASATVRPIGPTTEIGVQPSGLRELGTTPGRRAESRPRRTWHAGMRSEPPVSEPVQTGSMSQRQRGGRAARRAAGIEVRIERIAGGAPHRVARVGAGAHLGHVGLARDDGAGRAQPRHQHVVLRGHVAAVDRRAVGGQQALRSPPGP